jgi:MFS family permease
MKYIVITRTLFTLTSAVTLAQLPIQLERVGLSSVGEVVATFTLLQCLLLVLGTWVSAWLACRVKGHRNVVLSSLGLYVFAQALYLIGASYVSLVAFFLAQSIHGFVHGYFFPLSNTLMEQSFKEGSERNQRGFLQSFMYSAEIVGAIVGVSLATSHLGWFTWVFGIGASLLVFFLFYIDNVPNLEVKSRKLSWRGLMEVNSLKATYPVYFLAIVQGMLLVSSSLYLLAKGTNPTVLIIGQWIGIGSMSFFGYLTQKKGNLLGISIGMICLMLGLIGLIYAPQLNHFAYVGFLITGILLSNSINGVWLCFQNIAQEAADKDKQTEGHSGFFLLWRLGILTGQLISAHLGHLNSWYTSLGIVIMTFFLVFLHRRILN